MICSSRTLWHHDHVMGVTRFKVYAGLAGLWIVRDERELELELPHGPPYELPFGTDDAGNWVWGHNPAGMFEDWNPEVVCS